MDITAVINDIHRPFHDEKALSVVYQILKDVKPSTIILNGDLLDMYNVNSHGPNHPLVGSVLYDEIEDSRLWIDWFRSQFANSKIVFLYGNHEWRLERFIIQHAKALFDFVKLEKLLKLKDLDIEFHHYNHRYRIGKTNTYVQHSPPSYSKNGAMTSLERDIDQTSIYGCTHRQQVAMKSAKSGEQYACYFNGWLGSTTATAAHKKVFQYAKGHESWQQCFSLVYSDKKFSAVEQISIHKGKAIYGGKLYEASGS